MRLLAIAGLLAAALLVSGCTSSDTAALERIKASLTEAEKTLEGANAKVEAGQFDGARDAVLNAKLALDRAAVDASALTDAKARDDVTNYVAANRKLADAMTDLVDGGEAGKSATAQAKAAPREALGALKSGVAKLESAKRSFLEAKAVADRIQDVDLKRSLAGLDTLAQEIDRAYITPINAQIADIEKAAAPKTLVDETAGAGSGQSAFYAFDLAQGAQVSVDVGVRTPVGGTVDVFLLNANEYASYQNEGQGRGKFQYARENANLNVNSISFTFTAPAGGTYYLVIDNSDLPSGGAPALPAVQAKVKVVVQ